MKLQDAVALLVVAGCGIYLIRSLMGYFRGSAAGGCPGCHSCSAATIADKLRKDREARARAAAGDPPPT